MVVDDLEVSDCFTFSYCGEMHLRFGFTGSLCVDGEVSRFPHFDTCRVLKMKKISINTNNLELYYRK